MEEMRGGGRMAVFTETGLYSLVSKLGGQPVSPSCYAHARLRLEKTRAKRGEDRRDIYFPILFGRGTSIIEEFPGVILYIQLCAYFILVLLFKGIIIEILGIEDCRDCEEIKSL